MGLGWDLGERSRPPLALIQRTLKTQFIKTRARKKRKSHQNQKLNSGKICLFFFSKRQKATNSSGPELPRRGVFHGPQNPAEGWGARRGELFTKSTLDGKALGLQQPPPASCPASEKAGEARVTPASSASSPSGLWREKDKVGLTSYPTEEHLPPYRARSTVS